MNIIDIILLQGGTQDGTRFCVMFFGINFPHRRMCTNGKEDRAYLCCFCLGCYWVLHHSYSICEFPFLGGCEVRGIDGGALIGSLDVWLDCLFRCKTGNTGCKMVSVGRSANCGGFM
jgi:hypothetical protein